MQGNKDSLSKILNLDVTVDIVDIGANPVDGDGAPPYEMLVKSGLARVTGFDPNPEALEKLKKNQGKDETYLPYAVGDGKTHTFSICRAEGMSSLLRPNMELLEYFHGFSHWGEVMEIVETETVRLDDIGEITAMDFLKMDTQGSELLILENGQEKLAHCLVVHTEVEFLPMYVDQPLFSEVEMFLRERGFVFHRFEPLASRMVRPLLFNNNKYAEFKQLTWADAVFIRDFTKFDRLSPQQLLKLAVILHDVYGSHDLVLRALMEYDDRENTGHADGYLGFLGTSRSA